MPRFQIENTIHPDVFRTLRDVGLRCCWTDHDRLHQASVVEFELAKLAPGEWFDFYGARLGQPVVIRIQRL